MASGYTRPRRTVVTTVISTAVRRLLARFMADDSRETDRRDHHVDQLDPDERNDDAAESVNQQVATKERRRTDGAVVDAAQRQWDERHDDQRVENHRRQDR